MKALVLLSLFILTGTITTILLLFWSDDIYYIIKGKELERKYVLVDGNKLDLWEYDTSQNPLGIVITDSTGGLLLYQGKWIQDHNFEIGELLRYKVQDNRVLLEVAEKTGARRCILIDEHGFIFLTSHEECHKNTSTDWMNLKDSHLVDWLRYKQGVQFNFIWFTFTILFFLGLSIYLGIVLYKIIVVQFRK